MKPTGRRQVLAALGTAALCAAYPAAAQRRPRRIGYLSGAIPAITTPMLAGFRAGMAEHGWLEGRDYVIEPRHAAGVQTAVPGLAESLLATGPDVLLSTGEDTVRQLADRTKTIPIVMTVGLDPVGYGLVRSLQRPGGNVTGVVVLTNDLGAKRLQFLKEVFPRVNHVGVLFEPKSRVSTAQVEPIEDAARRIGVRITRFGLERAEDVEAALKQGMTAGVQAYLPVQGIFTTSHMATVVSHGLRTRVPSLGWSSLFAENGGLIAYGASAIESNRRAAGYVDKLFRGANAAELPIEQPTAFELTINLKTAKAMDVTFPRSVLLRADRVIE